jgi:hypothetical protein
MRGISVMDLRFPDELQDPDMQVKCLAFIAKHVRDICPSLPVNVRLFVMRGRSTNSRKDVPLLGLHEKQFGGRSEPWDYVTTLGKLQQWIDQHSAADLIAKIASVDAPTFDELDDRKK